MKKLYTNTIAVLESLQENRQAIENNDIVKITFQQDIEFEVHTLLGICDVFNEVENLGVECLLTWDIFNALGLDLHYPVTGEDFYADGNLWSTTNPTHNAEGRWKLVQDMIDYLKGQLREVSD